MTVALGDDEVRSYAGMRSFGVGPDAEGVPRLLLNGEPYFHAGSWTRGTGPTGCSRRPPTKPWSTTSRP
ncbi:hypothetical protein NKG05_08380 [Oerskovia sp. M15]